MLRKDVFGLSFATRFRITIIFQRAKTLLRILELMALKSVVMNAVTVFELVQAVVVA